jgi:hypothetical protein
VTVTVSRPDIAGDVGVLLMASGPADRRDRTCVERAAVCQSTWIRRADFVTSCSAASTFSQLPPSSLRHLRGRPYDEVVAEWKAIVDGDLMGSESS